MDSFKPTRPGFAEILRTGKVISTEEKGNMIAYKYDNGLDLLALKDGSFVTLLRSIDKERPDIGFEQLAFDRDEKGRLINRNGGNLMLIKTEAGYGITAAP